MTTATSPSPVTLRSRAFVEAHRAEATALGTRLADLVDDPEELARALRTGLAPLGDAESAEGVVMVTPGLGPVLGVRLPLLEAVHRTFKSGTRRTSSSVVLSALDRLLREELREIRWLAIWDLYRFLPTDPERTWQLLRRSSQAADEWITVDTLAHPYGAGILLDARRWAELDQLIYSPSRWERRLVGSTLATIVFEDKKRAATGEIVEHGLGLVGELIGDAEPDVQKALSWALRSLASRDAERVTAFCEAQTGIAVDTADGHRAWVVRDTLAKLPAERAAAMRGRLEGIRRKPAAPPTSRASAIASEFLAALPASPSAQRERRE